MRGEGVLVLFQNNLVMAILPRVVITRLGGAFCVGWALNFG